MILLWDSNGLTRYLLYFWWCHSIYWLLLFILLLPPACWFHDPPNPWRFHMFTLSFWHSLLIVRHLCLLCFKKLSLLCSGTRDICSQDNTGYHDDLGIVRTDYTYLQMNKSFSSLWKFNPPVGTLIPPLHQMRPVMCLPQLMVIVCLWEWQWLNLCYHFYKYRL